MITIRLAGVNIGIENQYDIAPRLEGWITDGQADFTVRVTPQELIREDEGRGMAADYLEFICAYRHIAERMPDYGAFVFHGAAIVMDELAYLFTAPSGTGKTTHAQLWRYGLEGKAWFLNGDKPILRRTPDGFHVCGTPWRGKEEYGVNEERPLQGLCLLSRGSENRIVPARSEEMVRFMLKEFETDPKRIWDTNMFGKSLYELVNEGLHTKLSHMPDDARAKLSETLGRIVNEGSGGLICIIL